MTPSDVGRAFLGFSKWAAVVSYPTPDGERWGWCGIGAQSHQVATGFLSLDEAWRNARSKGFEVDDAVFLEQTATAGEE